MHPFSGMLAAGTLWTPKTIINNIAAWWDAQALTSITQNGSNQVSQWDSQVGSHSGTTTVSADCVYSSTGLNSRPALVFSGSGGNLDVTDLTGFPQGTSNGDIAIVAAAGASGTERFAFGYGTGSGGARQCGVTTGNNIEFSNSSAADSAALSWASAHVALFNLVPGGTSVIYADTSQSSVATISNTINSSGTTCRIGLAPIGQRWNGAISEIYVFNTNLSSGNRDKLFGYLAWKWGLQANLPAGHPYKNGPPVGHDNDNYEMRNGLLVPRRHLMVPGFKLAA